MGEVAEVELQGALVAALSADGPVMAVAGGVYDRPPQDVFKGRTAYITIGSSELRPDDADDLPGVEVAITLNVWSTAVGKTEAKRLAARVRKVLEGGSLTLTDNALVQLVLERQVTLDQPDGVTTQVAMTFSGQIETR